MENHISNIKIKAFRGIKSLELKDLQQINILTGDNNCGKTSVLEVLRSIENPYDFKSWMTLLRKDLVGPFALKGRVSFYEGFYDLFDINAAEKKIGYDVELKNGETHTFSMAAEETEEEMTEEEIESLHGFYQVTQENKEWYANSTEMVPRLDLKIEIDGEQTAKDSIYKEQEIYSPEKVNVNPFFEGKIIHVSPVCHAEGGCYH